MWFIFPICCLNIKEVNSTYGRWWHQFRVCNSCLTPARYRRPRSVSPATVGTSEWWCMWKVGRQDEYICKKKKKKSWQNQPEWGRGSLFFLQTSALAGQTKFIWSHVLSELFYGKIIKEVCGRTVALDAFG